MVAAISWSWLVSGQVLTDHPHDGGLCCIGVTRSLAELSIRHALGRCPAKSIRQSRHSLAPSSKAEDIRARPKCSVVQCGANKSRRCSKFGCG